VRLWWRGEASSTLRLVCVPDIRDDGTKRQLFHQLSHVAARKCLLSRRHATTLARLKSASVNALFMSTTTLNIAAACLFDTNGRLLLVRKRNTHAFMLPGGKAEPGEAPLAALIRELGEELNLSLPEGDLSYLGEFHTVAANEADTWINASLFKAELPHPVSPAAELEELRWLAATDPLPATLAPLLREHVLPLIWPDKD
jgi:8-oxo-dGTP diphosphatase